MKKVLIVGADDVKKPTFAYQCKAAFRKLGFKTSSFNYRKFQFHRFKLTNKFWNSMLVRKVKSFNPDVVLIIKGEAILPGTLSKFPKKTLKVNWILDNPFGLYGETNLVRNIAEYDYFFSFDASYLPELEKRYKKVKFHFLPLATDPNIYREIVPVEKRKYIADVSFIGTYEKKREKLLKNLVAYNLKIYGYHWNECKDYKLKSKIQKEIFKANKNMQGVREVCKHNNLAKININVHAEHAIEGGINLRVFETLATNSFLLTDYVKGMERMFKLNKEIVCYHNLAELKSLIDYYLKHEEERIKIAKAGQKRILKEHKVIDRIKEMLRIIKNLN